MTPTSCTLCFCFLLAPLSLYTCRMVPEISGVVGQCAELDCGAEQEIGTQRTVSWQRQQEQEAGHQVVARFTTGSEARLCQRLSLLHDSKLYFIIRNVSRSDLGTYTCQGQNGTSVSSELQLTDNCTSGFSMVLHNASELNVPHLPAVPPNGNATLPPHWCIGELFVSPCSASGTALSRGQGKRLGRKGQTHLLRKVSLQPGYSVSMERGATLVIGSLAYHHAGTYICKMGKTVYQVKLRVLGPGILHSVSRIWIILVTVISSLGLYVLLVTLMLTFRRKQKDRTHTERISRIMGGLFRHRSESDLHFSENKDSGTELNGTTVREASCSTNYENLGSRENVSPGEQHSLSDHLNTETEAAQSYENLCADGEEEDDDYLDPASENESTNTEDYMEPDGETAVRQQSHPHRESSTGPHHEWKKGASVYAIPNKAPREEEEPDAGPGLRVGSRRIEPHQVQIEENARDGDSSEEDYAIPDSEDAVPLKRDIPCTYSNPSKLPEQSVEQRQQTVRLEPEADPDPTPGNDDYMKMNAVQSASLRNNAPNVGQSSTEEAARMERCRKLFMQKFQSNTTHYGREGDEAVGSSRTPKRLKKSHGTWSMAERMATLPE